MAAKQTAFLANGTEDHDSTGRNGFGPLTKTGYRPTLPVRALPLPREAVERSPTKGFEDGVDPI
jgi:hypothetical protein